MISFLFLPYSAFTYSSHYKSADGWKYYIDNAFADGKNIDALDIAAEKVGSELGVDCNIKVFLTMFHTVPTYGDFPEKFGDLDGDRQKYAEIYRELTSYKKKLAEINTDEAEKERLRDMLEYQIKDIDSKKLKDGEEEILESEKLRLSNLEKINKQVNFAERCLSGGEKGASASYLLSRASLALEISSRKNISLWV